MQTFLPYSDFEKSVKCLDYRRLGKQRVEAYQILKTLRGQSNGWKNHPACKMWKGYEDALAYYMNCCIKEWISRGYKNTMKIESCDICSIKFPHWLNYEPFHSSHRSNLLRKNPDWYKQFNWAEKDNIPYTWPIEYTPSSV